MPLALPLVVLSACLPSMDDNSRESFSIQPDQDEDVATLSGVVEVSGDVADGDWVITVEDRSWGVHSAARNDLSILSGEALDLVSRIDAGPLPDLGVSGPDGPRFVASAAYTEDGSTWFGRAVWAPGRDLGVGTVVNDWEEEEDVTFVEVEVAADDGDVVLLPGEPASVRIDGAAWRVTVDLAYRRASTLFAGCEAPDLLEIELLRTDEAAGPALVAPSWRTAPASGVCG